MPSHDALGEPLKPPVASAGDVTTNLPNLITNLIRLATVGAGIFVLINLITAGYGFISAGGDPKKVENAWAKIQRSLIGLVIIVAAVAIISIVERVVFGQPGFILQPTISGPGSLSN